MEDTGSHRDARDTRTTHDRAVDGTTPIPAPDDDGPLAPQRATGAAHGWLRDHEPTPSSMLVQWVDEKGAVVRLISSAHHPEED